MVMAVTQPRLLTWWSGSNAPQPRSRVQCCAVQATTPHDRHPYASSDGRPKSTMEEAFRLDRQMDNAPWRFSWQKNERNLVFDDHLKIQLIKGFAAKELGLSDEVMDARLTELALLLPDLPEKMPVMQVRAIALMAADTKALAEKLLALRKIFPSANISKMVTRQPQVVLEHPLSDIEGSAERLKTLLPGLDVDRLVEQYPNLLNVESFESALKEARRMMPDLDLTAVMTRNPDFIFGVERRANMIPYDD